MQEKQAPSFPEFSEHLTFEGLENTSQSFEAVLQNGPNKIEICRPIGKHFGL